MWTREIPAALLLVSGAAELHYISTTLGFWCGLVMVLAGGQLLRRR